MTEPCSCGACFYFDRDNETSMPGYVFGLCRRHPPSLPPQFPHETGDRWPSVTGDDWCGEYLLDEQRGAA